MNKYGVPVSHVIRHYDVTGKICPNPYVYNTSAHTWDEFKRKISGQAETPQGGNEKTIWNFLTGKGLNAYAVACIMGNLYAESGLMPVSYTHLQTPFLRLLIWTQAALLR